MKPLALFWARGKGSQGGLQNAGDWYSPLICGHLSQRTIVYAPPYSCDLVAVGSLLHRLAKSHRLHRLGLHRRLHIWGTGSLRAEDRLAGSHHAHAVRGELTRHRVRADGQDTVLGDPGLLADRLITPASKTSALGVIPHMVDRHAPAVLEFVDRTPGATLIDICWPVPRVLASITACERILSSSLHGLIFADAFGIPNQWFRGSDRILGDRHKFDDYYSAFGIAMDPVDLARVDLRDVGENYLRPGIDEIKQSLTKAFPYLP